MKQAIRLYFKHMTLPIWGMNAVFALFVAIGIWASGTRDGLFGAYLQMLPMYSVIVTTVWMLYNETLLNLALSFGGRRKACYCAFQLCLLLGLCACPLVQRALPAAVGQLAVPGEAPLHFSGAGILTTALVALLCSELYALLTLVFPGKTAVRVMGMLACLILGMTFGILTTLDNLAEFPLFTQNVYAILFAVCIGGSALCAFLLYKFYQKAVVRV